jgi:heme oxygenase (biliverdin-producing, ferredoxin)
VPATTLLESLRAATWPMHRAVERAGVMPALLRGQLGVQGFAALQFNLQAVYAALEPALLQHRSDPRIGPVCRPGLFRHTALCADLAGLSAAHPALPREAWALTPAARAYAARLRALAASAPVALVAHAYVRYLGDLNGGQSLARTVRRMLGGSAGTAFYDFGTAAQVALQVASLRAAIDALPLSPEEVGCVVAEAQWAFRQHGAMFEELASGQSGLAPASRTVPVAEPGTDPAPLSA